MGNFLDKLLKLIEFWKLYAPALAVCYLLHWVFQFVPVYNLDFKDTFFGFFPTLLDEIFLVKYEVYGTEFTMGYVYSAIILVLLVALAAKLEKKIEKLSLQYKKQALEVKLRKQNKKKQEILIKEKPFLPNVDRFYGLFDIKLGKLFSHSKVEVDLAKLKNEYLKMAKATLQKNYPKVQFAISDKIFMLVNDFSVFDSLLDDLVKLFNVFKELDDKKNISTKLLLSFEGGSDNSSSEFALKLLSNINNLLNYDKIIVLDKFAQKYNQEKQKNFKTISCGILKIEMENFNEMDIEIHQLKRK